MNLAFITVEFTSKPEVKYGKSGKAYVFPKGVMVSKNYDDETTRCDVRGMAAFGEVAERLALVDVGPLYELQCELGGKAGNGEYAGKTFMEWVIRSVARKVTSSDSAPAAATRAPAKKAAAAEESDGEGGLPFGWLIWLATLGLGFGQMMA